MSEATSLRGATVVVTGSAGFIGSHLTERLVAEGAKVRAVVHYNSQGTWGWLDTIPADVRAALDVRLGDVRDAEWVSEVCRDAKAVFHLAALIAIPHSYVAPRSVVETNVVGTLNVLEAARRWGISRVVHTSTSEVYGTPAELPIRETHPLNAQSPYAASKVAADQLALSYQKSFGVPVVVLRPFNTYGPRQSARAVLPAILTQLLAGKKEIKLGRLDTRRDLTFVADTVDGFVRAAVTPGIEGESIQLGTGTPYSIEELFTMSCRVTGVDAKVVTDERRLRPDASEVLVLQSDPAVATARLGWSARTSLEEGLRRTCDFLRQNLGSYKPNELHL